MRKTQGIVSIFLGFLMLVLIGFGLRPVKAVDETGYAVSQNIEECTNKNVTIKVLPIKGQTIADVKWKKGLKTESYFETDGNSASIIDNAATFTVKTSGNFSIYVTDSQNNHELITYKISNIDKTAPQFSPVCSTENGEMLIKLNIEEELDNISKAVYVEGKVTSASSIKWNSATEITNKSSFKVSKEGDYSILVTDLAGNQTIQNVKASLEMRAVWISYLEFANAKVENKTEAQFKAWVNTMFDKCVAMNMNAVVVQVRPFGDALYDSDYFPWSKYVSGKQGQNPGYDPLKYMVEAAHKRQLQIHAWLNPYRVTSGDTKISNLSSDNPARKWRKSSSKSKQRNVLTFNGSLYYNPAKSAVRNLIVNGVVEIVEKYDVDGIHFDDYFYPTLGSNYKTVFDYTEYKSYVSDCKNNNTTPSSIVSWRRKNVNKLIRAVYKAIKEKKSDVQFGISPAGNINNIYANDRYYVAVKTWMKSEKYVDYVCPQIYWSFEHSICPYDKTLTAWTALKKSDTVKLYVGIAAYRAGISASEAKSIGDTGWSKSSSEMKKQVQYGRNTKMVDGYMFYRYDNLISSKAKKEVANLKGILQ